MLFPLKRAVSHIQFFWGSARNVVWPCQQPHTRLSFVSVCVLGSNWVLAQVLAWVGAWAFPRQFLFECLEKSPRVHATNNKLVIPTYFHISLVISRITI